MTLITIVIILLLSCMPRYFVRLWNQMKEAWARGIEMAESDRKVDFAFGTVFGWPGLTSTKNAKHLVAYEPGTPSRIEPEYRQD